MLPLLLAGVVFVFLVLGSVVFLACVLLPRTRQYALSAALWCAMWGPCSVALMLIAGVGLIATAFVAKTGNMQAFHAPRLLSAFGWSYLTIGVLIAAIVATGTAWLHQIILKRTTFTLFRIYLATVSAGIGGVFGGCLELWMMSNEAQGYGWSLWAACMLALISGFCIAAYKGARALRGEPPKGYTWISPAEFLGD